MSRDNAQDGIEAVEVLHGEADADLHFRFFGTAIGRQFVVNVQFASEDLQTKERLPTDQREFLVGKILALVLDQLARTPRPGRP